MPTFFELIRLLLCAALVYVVIPRLVFGGQTVRSFVHAAFFLQTTALVLGDWKLYLPGSFLALYAAWCASAAWLVRRRSPPQPARAWAHLMVWLEEDRGRAAAWETPLARVREHWSSPVKAAVAVIAAVVALRAAWFALHNVRLFHLESYSRAISLHTLTRGELWDHDPSVALLAPLAWLGGLTPDQVIRLSGAVVAAGLTLATAFAGWRLVGGAVGAVWSAGLFAALMLAWNVVPVEPSGAELSAIFIVLAAGLARGHRGTASLALLTALLIHAGLSPMLLIAAVALTLASLLPAATGRVPALAALAVMVCMVANPPRGVAPEHQYESAARAAHRIAGEFRTNDWVVVSPGLEVAQTYGRGWHVELADFVANHTDEQVARSTFQFPYQAQSIFVFVEKRVLEQPAFSFVQDAGSAPYYYHTRLGRASLEFRAARLMAAYRGSHDNTQVYFEDADLIIYRIERAAAAPGSTAPGAGPQF